MVDRIMMDIFLGLGKLRKDATRGKKPIITNYLVNTSILNKTG